MSGYISERENSIFSKKVGFRKYVHSGVLRHGTQYIYRIICNCGFNVGMMLKVYKLKLCKESICSTENESHMITWAESVRRKNHI